MTCPLIVAKKVVGAHFSRDYDDDPSADMVTIDSNQFSNNGTSQFYVSVRLLDYARHKMKSPDIAECRRLFREYYPYIASTPVTLGTNYIIENVEVNAGVSSLIRRHLHDIDAQLVSFEDRLRVRVLTTPDHVTITERPSTLIVDIRPAVIHEWLTRIAKWLRKYDLIIPSVTRRPPRMPAEVVINIPGLQTQDEYMRYTQMLLDEEATAARYLAKVEQYYTWVSGFLNDISDAISI